MEKNSSAEIETELMFQVADSSSERKKRTKNKFVFTKGEVEGEMDWTREVL